MGTQRKLSRKERRKLRRLRKERATRIRKTQRERRAIAAIESTSVMENDKMIAVTKNGTTTYKYKEGSNGASITNARTGQAQVWDPETGKWETKTVSVPAYNDKKTKTKADCYHAGYLSIIRLKNGTVLHGASDSLADPTYSTQLVIKCNGVRYAGDKHLVLPNGYEDLQAYEHRTPEIQIDWPDFAEPMLQPGFWLALYNKLPSGDVLVFCQGGHGRTGTAIACLMVASGEFDAADAIDFVRNKYCPFAIEALSQEQYIASVEQALTGKVPTTKPRTRRRIQGAASYQGISSNDYDRPDATFYLDGSGHYGS